MIQPDQPKPVEEPKPSRLEEARRIIEEYANELRELLRKMRHKMN
jgi:hypothetical protein